MEAMNFTREQLAQYILNNAKDSLITKLKAIIEKEEKNDIVAYSIDGKPLTFDQYRKELEEAEKEIEKGEFLTSSELEKEIDSWK